MRCEAIGCSELKLQHPPAGASGLAAEIGAAFRALVWTLPPAHDPSEFRTHAARLR